MPVENLPPASWQSSLALGFVSSVFDNIPLTALALKQGGYDWGILAFAVGFGGSMIWFGSSAGVALSNMYPEARSVGLWLRHGWHIAIAYVIGLVVMLALLGWHPDARRNAPSQPAASAAEINTQGITGATNQSDSTRALPVTDEKSPARFSDYRRRLTGYGGLVHRRSKLWSERS